LVSGGSFKMGTPPSDDLMGFDEKKPLGEKETGAQAALPIWIDFMRAAIAQPGRKDEAFLRPPAGSRKATVKKVAALMPRHAGDPEAH